jgi:hypothetical protein
VSAGVPTRRCIATADVPALRATSQVHPPAAGVEAFNAAGSARLGVYIDRL